MNNKQLTEYILDFLDRNSHTSYSLTDVEEILEVDRVMAAWVLYGHVNRGKRIKMTSDLKFQSTKRA